MNKEKAIERIQELYAQDRVALRCEREELGVKQFALKYDLRNDTITKYCPGICDRSNTIRKHIQRGATYPELRKMGYSDAFIVRKMKLYGKPLSESDKMAPVEVPRPVHKEYVAYYEIGIPQGERPLKCEKTRHFT